MLKKNVFQFESTNLISSIFFSTPKNFNTFENLSEDYFALIGKRDGKLSEEETAQLKLKFQLAFSNFQDIDTVINKAFQKKGIKTKVKVQFSISRIKYMPKDSLLKEETDTKLKDNELFLFGDKTSDNHDSFYSFHSISGNNYLQTRLYINYPEIWKYLFLEMKEMLIGILIVMIIIFGIFLYSIKTMIKQKKLSDIKNDFINNITHELNTPISTIRIAGLNLLKNKVQKNPSLITELSETILRQNKRLQTNVSKVMEASLMENQSDDFNFENHSLHERLNDIITDIEFAHQKENLQIEKLFEAQDDILKLDAFYFDSAIINLVDNAIKYSKSPANISVSTINTKSNLEIRIKDNGFGIPFHKQTLIFDKFYRIPKGNIHTVKGLGLGLFIVKKVIEAHQATIEVKSKSGEGSTFIIRFPKQNK